MDKWSTSGNTMDFRLNNKKVLVLGASSGIGLAIAKAFKKENADVVIAASNLERIQKAALEIGAKGVVCDLLEKDMAKKLFEDVGPVDILVTNAGGPPKGNFLDMKKDDWELGYKLLFQSAVDIIEAFLPSMKEKKFGRILLNTSYVAKEPSNNLTLSNAYRSALLAMSKSLATEVAKDGVTVNPIMPGFIDTERLKDFKVTQEFIDTIPAKRIGKTEEIASLFVYLASKPPI